MSGQVFVRIQSPDVSARGIHVGVFGLVNMLGRDGLLSPEDEAYRVAKNRWFDTTLRGAERQRRISGVRCR